MDVFSWVTYFIIYFKQYIYIILFYKENIKDIFPINKLGTLNSQN